MSRCCRLLAPLVTIDSKCNLRCCCVSLLSSFYSVFFCYFFFFSSRRRHTRCSRDWSSDVCSSDLSETGGDARPLDCSSLLRHFLLAGDRATRTLLGARVRVRALATHRQSAAVPDAAIRSDIHQSLDVHRDFRAQRAFDAIILFDRLTQTVHVRIGEIANPERAADASLLEDLTRGRPPHAKDVCQPDLDLLVAREIDACNTSHVSPAAACAWGFACR